MGPQHPSTHGVLRLILELDGETITQARLAIGYLHTGIEKNSEYRNFTQAVTFLTRADYLSPLFTETGYSMAVEKLLGITDEVPGSRAGDPHHDDGAQPDLLAPGLARHRRPRDRRAVGDALRVSRARAHPRHLRDDQRPANEPRLHSPRRRHPGSASGRGREDPRVRAADARADRRVPQPADRPADLD